MNKLLMAITAASALTAAPAVAQYTNANAGGTVGIGNRISQLDARFSAGLQAGLIDRQEAQSIRPQLRELRRLERRYSMNGLTQQERQDLQQRLRTIRQQIRTADGGRYDRDMRYGNWENDAYYGQGGPYQTAEEVCERRGGLGGVIDNVFGRQNCGLGVGQRVSGNLYSVPYEYRNTYRDGNGVYYRTDGRSIYQIDARTNTVVRVYGMDR